MKKSIALILLVGLALGLVSCSIPTYKVEFASDNYPIVNDLKKEYAAGEEVTIQLETLTEHYYVLFVNDVEQTETSIDQNITCFTFTMPSEDVLIKIEDRWVNIPDSMSLAKVEKIELIYHGNPNNFHTISDEPTCSLLFEMISQADGTRGESTKGHYGVPYGLRVYFEGEEECFFFSLWNKTTYSTNMLKNLAYKSSQRKNDEM